MHGEGRAGRGGGGGDLRRGGGYNAGIDSIAVCSGAHSPERLYPPTFLFASLQEAPAVELPS